MRESVFPFYHEGSADGTQVARLSSKCFYLPSLALYRHGWKPLDYKKARRWHVGFLEESSPMCCRGFGTTHWSLVVFAVGSRAKGSDSSPSQNLSVAHGSAVQSRLFSVSPSPSLTGDKAGLVWTSTGNHSGCEFIIATIVSKGWHFIVLHPLLWLLHKEGNALLCWYS